MVYCDKEQDEEIKELEKLLNQKANKCPIIGETRYEKPTHYCGIIMHKYAIQYIYENNLEIQMKEFVSKTRAFNKTATIFDQRVDFCAEWYCDWDSKQNIIYSFRNIIETIICSNEFGKFCCMIIINIRNHAIHFIGNTFTLFTFATKPMTQYIKPYTYLNGTIEKCFTWWLMPAKIR